MSASQADRRVPSFTELGISRDVERALLVQVSRLHLRGCDQGAWVIQGPARRRRHRHRRRPGGGVQDGEPQHPSYIELSGRDHRRRRIPRDVFTMGARPIACLNALSFGAPELPRPGIVSGVVAGVGGYGNSFGVPTVGGQVRFHTRMTAIFWSMRWRSASPTPTKSLRAASG